MASSFPPTDVVPAAEERRLERIAEQVEAIDALIGLARSTLRVFDRDLGDTGWNGARRAELLETFLRRGNARFALIVHDTRYIETACPRLLSLAKVYGHALQLWRTGAEARGATDSLVIADERHYLHRYHVDQPRATLALSHAATAKPLVARFEEIWATGEPALGGGVLGL
jgi:hypothetical protein